MLRKRSGLLFTAIRQQPKKRTVATYAICNECLSDGFCCAFFQRNCVNYLEIPTLNDKQKCITTRSLQQFSESIRGQKLKTRSWRVQRHRFLISTKQNTIPGTCHRILRAYRGAQCYGELMEWLFKNKIHTPSTPVCCLFTAMARLQDALSKESLDYELLIAIGKSTQNFFGAACKRDVCTLG